jgi:hypothetical protein
LINKNSFHFSYFDNIEDLQRTDFPVNYFKEGIFETASIEYFDIIIYLGLMDLNLRKLNRIL